MVTTKLWKTRIELGRLSPGLQCQKSISHAEGCLVLAKISKVGTQRSPDLAGEAGGTAFVSVKWVPNSQEIMDRSLLEGLFKDLASSSCSLFLHVICICASESVSHHLDRSFGSLRVPSLFAQRPAETARSRAAHCPSPWALFS